MIKITADSTCDLSPELLRIWNVSLSPLCVVVDGEIFHDGVTIRPSEIFTYVDQGKNCSTAAGNIDEYYHFFKKHLDEGAQGIVHISISSHLSCSYANAHHAASYFPNVVVVDSLNISSGSALMVKEAVSLAQEGFSTQEIAEKLHALSDFIEFSFDVNNIDYLRRGGRCSALEATGAKILNIKPSIEVEKGKLSPSKKYRGTFPLCIKNYVSTRLSQRTDIDTDTVFITHCECNEELLYAVKEQVLSLVPFENVYIAQAGCTIACHCGPGTLGLLFRRKFF